MGRLPPNYYALLGVTPGATPEEIRQAYRLRARASHPDARLGVAGAAEDFKAIAEAYHTLSSPELRRTYDAQLRVTYSDTPDTPDTPDAATGTQPPHAPPAPSLALRVVAGAAGIGRLREPTRFYLLGELLAERAAIRAWSAPIRLAVLLDRSSSMRGSKIFEAKRAAKALFSELGAEDRLSLMLFDDRVETLLAGETPVGAVGAEMALDSAMTRGATQLGLALETAVRPLEADVTRDGVAALLLITDGRTYGDEARCLAVAERARLLGAPIICFGLGLEWNRELLDRIATVSGGSCAFVEEPAQLTDLVRTAITGMRATLASNIRMSLAPAPGVKIMRASVIAPEIADVFNVLDDQGDAGDMDDAMGPDEPLSIKLPALTTQPGMESVVALWDLLLDPHALTREASGAFDLGSVTANWVTPSTPVGSAERLSQHALASALSGDGIAPLDPETRLALELLTAYRLQTQADQMATSGAVAEAATALNTAALRLRAAGDGQRAGEAQQAALALLTSPEDGRTATLRVKYASRNGSAFHHLRRRLRGRQAESAP